MDRDFVVLVDLDDSSSSNPKSGSSTEGWRKDSLYHVLYNEHLLLETTSYC